MNSGVIRLAALLVVLSFAAGCAPTAAPGTTPRTDTQSSQPTSSGDPGLAGSALAETNTPVGPNVGQRAPAFSITGLDGGQVSDVALQAQGKPYILFFYAKW